MYLIHRPHWEHLDTSKQQNCPCMLKIYADLNHCPFFFLTELEISMEDESITVIEGDKVATVTVLRSASDHRTDIVCK